MYHILKQGFIFILIILFLSGSLLSIILFSNILTALGCFVGMVLSCFLFNLLPKSKEEKDEEIGKDWNAWHKEKGKRAKIQNNSKKINKKDSSEDELPF